MRWLSIPLAVLTVILLAAPAGAQTGQIFDQRAELVYSPMRVSSNAANPSVDASLSTITLAGEGRIYEGLIFGGSVSRGVGGSVTINQTSFSDPEYVNYRIGVKVPFNLGEFAEQHRVLGPRPAYAPVYAWVGYKNTSFTAVNPANNSRQNIEATQGAGFGLGGDVRFDPVDLYGEVIYYPQMFTRNVGAGQTGHLRVFEGDIGIRARLSDNGRFKIKVGYHYENHAASNVTIVYDGFQFGATAEF